MKWRARLFLILACVLLFTFVGEEWRRAHLESSQDKSIIAAARKYEVDPALIKAVVWRESRFNPRARGSKGEIGLMQIMENTAMDWAGAQRVPFFSLSTLRNPAQNVDCGAWYLRKSLARYAKTDDPVPYALADYNAGRGNALKWMTGEAATNSAAFVQQIGFPATREYVQAIQKRREKYRSQFETSK